MPTIVTMPKWGLTMTSEPSPVGRGRREIRSRKASLLTVETEKAVDDVEAPASGVLRKIVAAVGSEVPVMGAVAVITAPGEDLSDEDVQALVATSSGGTTVTGGASPRVAREGRQAARDASGRVNASPAARKRARELGIDLATVEATGPVDGSPAKTSSVPRQTCNYRCRAANRSRRASGRHKDRRAPGGPPDATETIVFLHGLGGSQSTWASVLGAFRGDLSHRRRRPSRATAPATNRRQSRPTTRSRASPRRSASFSKSWSLRHPFSIGHSLGGATALQLALDRPKLVRALVLVDSAALGLEINGELLDRIESAPSRDEARRLLELFFEDRRFVLERGIDDMYAARNAPGADDAVKAIAGGFHRRGQNLVLFDRLGELEVPLLVIWGELDRVIPSRHAVAALTALPTAWLEIMEGVGHVPQVEAAPAFAAIVNRWLASIPRP